MSLKGLLLVLGCIVLIAPGQLLFKVRRERSGVSTAARGLPCAAWSRRR